MPSPSARLTLALLPLALAACAIHQNVSPAAGLKAGEVCIVVNPAVFNEGFLVAYESALVRKGYRVRKLPVGASLVECPVVSTYTANWKWDLAMYMNYAEIKVYNEARPVGEAIYDSRNGSANMGKFIRADAKIAELVDQLYPGPAAGGDALRATGEPAPAPR
jgi:hypothetical protein